MQDSNYYLKIGPLIKELREQQNMTKTKLASGICSISYITRIENGERIPTSVILRQLAIKLGISVEYLFRSIESPSNIHAQELIDELILYVERLDFKNLYDLLNKKEKELYVESIHEIQLIKKYKCICKSILTENYETALDEIKNILNLTYHEGNNPTSMEFTMMYMYGYFLSQNNQKKEAYTHLKSIRKYLYTFKFLRTQEIVPRYYVYLISACLDTSNLDECFEYLDFSINYCKKYNKLTVLRELYFLKGELYSRLGKETEFKIWYDKSITLHELVKHSDHEYFEKFIKIRLQQLNKI